MAAAVEDRVAFGVGVDLGERLGVAGEIDVGRLLQTAEEIVQVVWPGRPVDLAVGGGDFGEHDGWLGRAFLLGAGLGHDGWARIGDVRSRRRRYWRAGRAGAGA